MSGPFGAQRGQIEDEIMVAATSQGYLDGAGANADGNLASERLLADYDDDADTAQEELDQELRTQPLLDSVRSKKTAPNIRSILYVLLRHIPRCYP